MAVGSIEGATMGSSVVNKLGAPEDCPRWCSLGDGDGVLVTLGTNDGPKLDSIEGMILGSVNGKPLGTLEVEEAEKE
jgi:hypothetical protein